MQNSANSAMDRVDYDDAYSYYAAPIEPDSAEDEGVGMSATSSLLSSIESELRQGQEENGRIYATYGANEYYLPVDEEELDRLDMNHQKYTMLMNDQLFLAPIDTEPHKILDLGTGTGIWCIDVADKYPAASVIGTDIAPIQPQWIPPNCQFQIDDAEDDWTFGENSFDFIHARDLYQSIRNWPRVIQQAYDHIRPGGYLELQSVWPVPTCDDNTLPEDCAYMQIARLFQDIAGKIGAEPDAPTKFKSWMEAAGFQDVVQTVLRVPCSPWPRDPRLKKIGALELMNVIEGSRAFILRGGTREFGKSITELEALVARCKRELCMNKIHGYAFFYVVYGRKPGAPVHLPTGAPTATSATDMTAPPP